MRVIGAIAARWRSLAMPRALTAPRFTAKDRRESRCIMARGEKDKYTDKQKRKAEHIADGYGERGVPKKEAKARAWATVNKESGGGNKSGSGRGKPDTNVSAKAGGRKGGRKTAAKKKAAKKTTAKKTTAKQASMTKRAEQRSAAAKKGWETRRQRSGAAAKVRKTRARKSSSR